MSEKKLLSVEEIFAAQDLETKTVDVPSWGGSVKFRQLSAKEGMELGKAIGDVNAKGSNMKILRAVCVGEDGTKLFKDEHVLNKLGEKNLRVINDLAKQAAIFIGLMQLEKKSADALLKVLMDRVTNEDGSRNDMVTVADLIELAEKFVAPEETTKNG